MAERLLLPPGGEPAPQPWPALRPVRVAACTLWWLPTPGRHSAAFALAGPVASAGNGDPAPTTHFAEHLIPHLRLFRTAPSLSTWLAGRGIDWEAVSGADWWTFRARTPAGEATAFLEVVLAHLRTGRIRGADAAREVRRLRAETAWLEADVVERLRRRLVARVMPAVVDGDRDAPRAVPPVVVVADVAAPGPATGAPIRPCDPFRTPPAVTADDPRPDAPPSSLRPPEGDAWAVGLLLPLGATPGRGVAVPALAAWLEAEALQDRAVSGGAYLLAAGPERSRLGDTFLALFACRAEDGSALIRRLLARLERLADRGPGPRTLVTVRRRLLLDLATDLDDPHRFVLRAASRLLVGEPAGPDEEAAAIGKLDGRTLRDLLRRALAGTVTVAEPLAA